MFLSTKLKWPHIYKMVLSVFKSLYKSKLVQAGAYLLSCSHILRTSEICHFPKSEVWFGQIELSVVWGKIQAQHLWGWCFPERSIWKKEGSLNNRLWKQIQNMFSQMLVKIIYNFSIVCPGWGSINNLRYFSNWWQSERNMSNIEYCPNHPFSFQSG